MSPTHRPRLAYFGPPQGQISQNPALPGCVTVEVVGLAGWATDVIRTFTSPAGDGAATGVALINSRPSSGSTSAAGAAGLSTGAVRCPRYPNALARFTMEFMQLFTGSPNAGGDDSFDVHLTRAE
jgi:hypothetical protein